MSGAPIPGGRVLALDLARSAALLGMAVFHFAYDLQFFGHLPPGTTYAGGWYWLAVTVAASFLFLSGISLQLAHGAAIRWPAFWRRLFKVAGAAALVSAATYAAFPDSFVYFGILHMIAVASLIGLAVLHLPALATLTLAAGVLLLPRSWRTDALPAPWFDWLGLSQAARPSVDFEPVFPWLAPFLAGLALSQIVARAGLWDRMRTAPADWGRPLRALAWPGRHSLLVYLLHQPVLMGLVGAGTWLMR